MTQVHSSKLLKIAATRPMKNEIDTIVRNHDGTFISVSNAPFIRALARGLGVTFNIVLSEDNELGVQRPDGSWTGIIGMLIKGEVDLSSDLLTVGKEGREKVNSTYPLYVTDGTFMTEKPKPHPKSFAIFNAFSFEMWIGIGLCVMLVSLLLYILLKKNETYSTILFETVGCLLEKSFSFQARRRRTALLLLFWFLGVTVLTNSYKSIILSVMTVPKMVGIRDAKDLAKAAKENSTMCMTYKGGRMWQIKSNDDRLKSIGECLKRAEKESLNSHSKFFSYAHKKAFISFRLDLIKFSDDYLISEDSFSLMYLTIPYSKHFCCPKKLDHVVHRMAAADLYPKMIRDRYYIVKLRRSMAKNDAYDTARWKPLSVKDFAGAFLVLIIGHLLSIIILISEFIAKHITLKHFKFRRNLRRSTVM